MNKKSKALAERRQGGLARRMCHSRSRKQDSRKKGGPYEMGILMFERRKLAKDTLSAIWGFCTDKKFLGHDGREYVIGRGGQKSETKNVLEMTVEMEGGNKALARYALLLIDIS